MITKISKDKFYLPKGSPSSKRKSVQIANAMAIELMQYGTVVDNKILKRIASYKPSVAKALAKELLDEYTLGKLNSPLFSHWEDRTYFSFDEVIMQIFAYVFRIDGNDLYDESYMENLLKQVDVKKFKTLSFETKDKAYDEFVSMLSSTVKLDRTAADKIVRLSKKFIAQVPMEVEIVSSQVKVALALGAIAAKKDLATVMEKLNFNWADTIRYAAAKEDFDTFNLPHDLKYANLKWSERVAILNRLSKGNIEDLAELFSKNQRAWDKFFKHIHLFSQRQFNKFQNVKLAYMIAGGVKEDVLTKEERKLVAPYVEVIQGASKGMFGQANTEVKLVYRSFESRVKSAVESKDINSLTLLLDGKATYILRNLAMLSQVVKKSTEKMFVSMVETAIRVADVSTLFSIIQINTDAKYRLIDAKGATSVQEANYSPVIKLVQESCKAEIKKRYGLKGKVKVEKKVRDQVVPFLVKNSELNRGTRIKIKDSKYLYFLIHWVQDGWRSVDIDHSVLTFKTNGDMGETLAFYDSGHSYMKSSGDITSARAPNGATEYCRLDWNRIPTSIAYMVPVVNVYSGENFKDIPISYAAWMESNSSKFKISQDHTKMDLNANAIANCPFVIDVKNREIVILDYNMQRGGRLAISSSTEVKKLIEAANSMKPLTVGELGELLSGDESETSMKFVEESKKDKDMEISDLYKLFN